MAVLNHIVPLLFVALFTRTAFSYPAKLSCGIQILTTSSMMSPTQISDDTHGFMLTSSTDGDITCGGTYSEGATLTVRLAPGKQVMLEAFSGGLFTSGDDLYNCDRKRSTTNDGTATIAPTAGIGNTLTLRGGWAEQYGQVHIPTECLLTSADPPTTSAPSPAPSSAPSVPPTAAPSGVSDTSAPSMANPTGEPTASPTGEPEYDFTSALGAGVVLQWTPGDSTSTFKLCVGESNAWLAFGTSLSGGMVDAKVVLGQPDDDSVENYHIISKGYSGVIIDDESEQDLTDVYVGGAWSGGETCMKWTRPKHDDDGELQDFIWAHGGMNDAALSYHTARGALKLNLLTGKDVEVADDGLRIWKLHALAMIVAWGVLAPCGIFAAAVLKRLKITWWFIAHRGGVVGAGVVSIIGFSIAYSNRDNGGFPDSLLHRIFGFFVVIAGAFVMPLLGIFRPHATEVGEEISSKRWMWELVHKNLGRLLGTLGFVNIFLGARVLGDDGKLFTIVAGVLVGICVCVFGYFGVVGFGVGVVDVDKKKRKSSDIECSGEKKLKSLVN